MKLSIFHISAAHGADVYRTYEYAHRSQERKANAYTGFLISNGTCNGNTNFHKNSFNGPQFFGWTQTQIFGQAKTWINERALSFQF
jgi:hypothetical protein